MKKNKIEYFKSIALRTADLSTCVSKHVGTILVKDLRIVGMGYNGTLPGKKHCNKIFKKQFDREKHHEWSLYNELHAEQNMLSFCAKNGIPTKDTSLFVTISPCINCAKIIIASGIKNVYYIEKYDKECGLDLLKKSKIKCYKI